MKVPSYSGMDLLFALCETAVIGSSAPFEILRAWSECRSYGRSDILQWLRYCAVPLRTRGQHLGSLVVQICTEDNPPPHLLPPPGLVRAYLLRFQRHQLPAWAHTQQAPPLTHQPQIEPSNASATTLDDEAENAKETGTSDAKPATSSAPGIEDRLVGSILPPPPPTPAEERASTPIAETSSADSPAADSRQLEGRGVLGNGRGVAAGREAKWGTAGGSGTGRWGVRGKATAVGKDVPQGRWGKRVQAEVGQLFLCGLLLHAIVWWWRSWLDMALERTFWCCGFWGWTNIVLLVHVSAPS